MTHLWGDGTGAALLSEKIHDVSGEFVASVLILVEFLVVDLSDLRQLRTVVGMLDRVICLGHSALSCSKRDRKRTCKSDPLPC